MWYFHYYANRITEKLFGIQFAVIEQKLFGPRLFEFAKFIEIHGYVPHFRHPRSFSEKVCYRKLFDRNPLFTEVADKWAVRDFVVQRVGSEILNKVYCVTSDAAKIPFDDLPEQFVIRATHGSRMNILIDNKAAMDTVEIARRCAEFLNAPYGVLENEVHYAGIPRQILIEQYLRTAEGPLRDYRFFVFHGRCELIQVDIGGVPPHARRFFTRDWVPLDYTTSVPLAPVFLAPPKLIEMMAIAERLAADFDFMRVDLYLLDDEKIVFGEITVTPAAGRKRFGPNSDVDFSLGSFWKIAEPTS